MEKTGAIPVIAVFDIGKTNKKLFLFNQKYEIVFEQSEQLTETADEDGYPCEDLESLQNFVFDSLTEVISLKEFDIKAVNFSAYGASLVYIGEQGKPLTPLCNYLKPYPAAISEKLYEKYGGPEKFSLETASPVLGSLNSGLQFFRLKLEQPDVFSKIKYALHLPQYLSYLLSRNPLSDRTSIGCHTALWDFQKNHYHNWAKEEGLAQKFPPVKASDMVTAARFKGHNFKVGIGLHDSSAALIPYLLNFHEPFVLISTGTWCISLNPFNHRPLTFAELQNDCLCYLQFKGKPVKASRVFLGHEHEQQVKRIAAHFNQDIAKYRDMQFKPELLQPLKNKPVKSQDNNLLVKESAFNQRNLADFENDIAAYYQLVMDMVELQQKATQLILNNTPVKRIFVDGGFSKNSVFMHLLAIAFPNLAVFAASMAHASAVGAALCIHQEWNVEPVPGDIIQLKYYPGIGLGLPQA